MYVSPNNYGKQLRGHDFQFYPNVVQVIHFTLLKFQIIIKNKAYCTNGYNKIKITNFCIINRIVLNKIYSKRASSFKS